MAAKRAKAAGVEVARSGGREAGVRRWGGGAGRRDEDSRGKQAGRRGREAVQQCSEETRRVAEELAALGAQEILVDLDGNPLPEAEVPDKAAVVGKDETVPGAPEEPASEPEDKPDKG